MLKKILLPIFFCFTFAASIALVSPVKQIRGHYLKESYTRIATLPSYLLQAFCLEFKGVAADLLFLKTMTFMGHNIGNNIALEKEEWPLLYHTLDRITDLDGRFWDPYVFAEMMLGWQAGMFDEDNALLEKATIARPEDYRPFFYLGFNHFYFLKNPAKAAPYLREAAKRPNAQSYIKPLAARMSLYGSQTVAGIIFLEDLLLETYDPIIKQQLETRLETLKKIHLLEKAVQEYKRTKHNLPDSLDKLVAEGIIEKIPVDPYGGMFVVLKNGRVYTTSELLAKPPR